MKDKAPGKIVATARTPCTKVMRNIPAFRPSLLRWTWLCVGLVSLCAQAATSPAGELIDKFHAEPYSWKQLDIADEIAKVATPGDLAVLLPLLSDADRHLRGNAAYLFAKAGDRRGFDTLVGILSDYSDQRVFSPPPGNCIRPTDKLDTEEGRRAALTRCPLVRARQIEEDRYYAVHLLGRLRDPRAVEVLIPLLDHDVVNYNAAWALGEIGDARAIPALITALSNKDALVRVSAIGALEKLRATESLPYLAELFGDTALPSAGERVPVGTVARKAADSLRRVDASTPSR